MYNRLVRMSLGLLLLSLPAWGQTNLGRILGAVTDQSGAVVPNASVTITDVQRGTSRNLTTDSAGEYSAPGLIPGTYTVRAEAMGFTTAERKDVNVQVGQDQRVDMALQVGAQTQVVTVSGEAPMVNTTSATMGGVIENLPLVELPVSGRNYLFLLQTRPGVQNIPGGGPNSYNTSGLRQSGQNYMFDGLFDSNLFTSALVVGGTNGGGGPDQANLLPIDAIQEVNVIISPKVEYGWKAGSVINVGLKSGTNNLHGTAYAFGNEDALNARNPFLLPTQPKQSVSLEQFGASIGGPIKKDKLFYFGTYEGQRYSVVAPRTAQVPTTQFLTGSGAAGSLPSAIAAMNSLGQPVNQLSLNLAGCANNGSTNGALISCNAATGLFGNSASTSNIASNFPTSGGSNNLIAKVDYNLNEHNTIHGEYYFGSGTFNAQTASLDEPFWESNLHSASQVVRAVWAWIPNSAWVNEARFGYDRIYQWALPDDCNPGVNGAPNYAELGLVTGVNPNEVSGVTCGLPTTAISTFTSIGSVPAGYSEGWYPQGVDSVSYTRGKHLFKFGGEFRLNNYWAQNAGGLKGTLSFGTTAAFPNATPLEDFLAGVLGGAGGVGGTIESGSPYVDITWQSYGTFFQDDWRITPKVTLNLGLRYEVTTPVFHATGNNLGSFAPGTLTGLVQQQPGSALTQTDYHNVQPRLGFAWDTTGKGTTVVRGSVGIFSGFDFVQLESGPTTPYLTPTGATLHLANGTTIQGPGDMNTGTLSIPGPTLTPNWAVNSPIFGTLSTTSTLQCGNGIAPNPSPCPITGIAPDIHHPYYTEWNLTVQHAFTSSLVWEIAYVGNHGTDLEFVEDLNQPVPGASGATNEQIRRPYYSSYPYLGQVKVLNNMDSSNFSALESTLTERLFHGLTLAAGYTYGHALDDASLDGANNPQIIMNSLDPKAEYGNSQFDIRNRFTLTGTYFVPGKKSKGQMLEGWEINSSLNLSSALPYNPFDTTSDISGTGEADDRWDLVGNPHDFWGYGGLTPIPCYGITASSFGSANGCTTVAAGPAGNPTANMPAACIAAASNLPGNPSVSGSSGLASLAKFGCYMSGSSVIVPPAQGTFGTMSRYELRGQPFRQWDLSVNKNWKINERLNTQFRAEFFNVLNLRNFNVPVPATNNDNPNAPGTFGSSAGTPDVVVNSPVIGSGSPRKIQFGLKLIF